VKNIQVSDKLYSVKQMSSVSIVAADSRRIPRSALWVIQFRVFVN